MKTGVGSMSTQRHVFFLIRARCSGLGVGHRDGDHLPYPAPMGAGVIPAACGRRRGRGVVHWLAQVSASGIKSIIPPTVAAVAPVAVPTVPVATAVVATVRGNYDRPVGLGRVCGLVGYFHTPFCLDANKLEAKFSSGFVFGFGAFHRHFHQQSRRHRRVGECHRRGRRGDRLRRRGRRAAEHRQGQEEGPDDYEQRLQPCGRAGRPRPNDVSHFFSSQWGFIPPTNLGGIPLAYSSRA